MNIIASTRLWLARKLAPAEFERLDGYRSNLVSLRQWMCGFADIRAVIEFLAARAGDAERMGMPANAGFEPLFRERIKRLRLKKSLFSILTEDDALFIHAEVARALRKFPEWPTDPLHAVAVLNEEVGELNKALLQRAYEPHKSSAADVRAEAIQVVTVALRFLASIDRYEHAQCEQHRQGGEK